MGGPDAAFQQMSLSKAQHLDGNAWIGRRNAALEQVHGPFVGEPNSPWFMAQGNAQAPNSATATAPSAQVICRRIFLPLGLFGDHCYIVVRQTNEPTTYIEVRRGSGDGGLNIPYYTTESDPANENVRLAHRGVPRAVTPAMIQCMREGVTIWNAKQLVYVGTPGPNSNTFAGWLTRRCDVPATPLVSARNFGWDYPVVD